MELETILRWGLTLVAVGLGLTTAGHALLHKRDPRAGVLWIAITLALPLVGPLLYFVLGVNRIRTRAQELRHQAPLGDADAELPDRVPGKLAELERIGAVVSGSRLVAGNRVALLRDGEEAYPAMLEAIDAARRRICLATYIFEVDDTGRLFVAALERARERGVEVRVLVDGVGELYSRPRVSPVLRRAKIRVARFLPPRLLPPTFTLNLRNHRKILSIDGRVAFVGGMNLGDRHLARRLENPSRVVDLHFRVDGPVVQDLEQVFVEDWCFATGEEIPPVSEPAAGSGDALCRAIVDGPNEDLGKLLAVLLGAVSAARSRIAIMTPYFLPPRELIGALQGAALRGVEVAVLLPATNNLPYVHWAMRKMLWQLLERGVRVYYQPGPFVHSKLFLVDHHYAQIGSANLDLRSLRLNFELAIEVYSRSFVRRLAEHFDAARERSTEVTLEELDARPLPIRLRDGLAWLFYPYL